jgi:hypothetical protein
MTYTNQYVDLSNPNEFSVCDTKYLDDFAAPVNGGYRRARPSAYWLERCGITYEQIADIRKRVSEGVSCRSIVHDTTIPLNIIQWIVAGKHPAFPEPVIVPDELKPKRGRKKHGENKVLDKYRKELTTYQEEAILAALKQLLVDGETEIAIRFPAFVLPPVWWPACERTSRGGHNNNFFYPLTRWYRVKKLLLSFSKADKVLMTEQEINLIYKQAKKMKEKLDV